MSASHLALHLPDYQTFVDSLAVLTLPVSGSELHGLLCGYLCAGAMEKGEDYLRALMLNKAHEDKRSAFLSLFDLYTVSHELIANLDFNFQLLLPSDHEPLSVRAQAFSEWCGGFNQGLALAGVGASQLYNEDTQEVMQHMAEFAELDYDSLQVSDEDEKAFMEVSEYARMAVLRIYSDLKQNEGQDASGRTAH